MTRDLASSPSSPDSSCPAGCPAFPLLDVPNDLFVSVVAKLGPETLETLAQTSPTIFLRILETGRRVPVGRSTQTARHFGFILARRYGREILGKLRLLLNHEARSEKLGENE